MIQACGACDCSVAKLVQSGSQRRLTLWAEHDAQLVRAAMPLLDLLRCTHRQQLAVSHDAKSVRQGLSLLHGVRREQHGRRLPATLALGRNSCHCAGHCCPQRAARRRVQAAARLVQDRQRRAAHQSDGRRELAFVPTAQQICSSAGHLYQLEVHKGGFHSLLRESPDRSEELEMVLDCQQLKQSIELRAVPKPLPGPARVSLHVEAAHVHGTGCTALLSYKAFDSRRLASPVVTEQTKDLSRVNGKRYASNRALR
mmetsp:Transcript_70993/g.127846  ORF Transcript_70993/g.127846 Transcript_70993/m.127846 type:complete len:256 (-) Transcript_70993:291-1058(-)